MKKLLIVFSLCYLFSGCAWISADRYYANSGASVQWKSEFRPGKSSTKIMGYPDTQIHTFSHPDIRVSVDFSYQDVTAFGPFIIPFIPILWETSGNLSLDAHIYVDKDTEIDLSQWIVKSGEKRFKPMRSSVVGMKELHVGKVNLKKDSVIYIQYEIKASDLEDISVEFNAVSQGGNPIVIPVLNLFKKKGRWHYEVWTV